MKAGPMCEKPSHTAGVYCNFLFLLASCCCLTRTSPGIAITPNPRRFTRHKAPALFRLEVRRRGSMGKSRRQPRLRRCGRQGGSCATLAVA